MIPAPPRHVVVLAALLWLGHGGSGIVAQEPPPEEPPPQDEATLPTPATAQEEVEISFGGQAIQTEAGDRLFTGPVAIKWRDSRIQADRMSIRENRYVEAEGNVLIAWQGNRIFGTRLDYDLKTERGVVQNAMGQAESDYMFWAKTAEKIGENRVRLRSATVTTCTQPVPYWAFSVSKATITINKYSRMWNVRFKARQAPIFYLPYLIWPVKQDRAPGLLFPEFQSSDQLGRSLRQDLFIPIGRSADVTLRGQYYSKAGLGGGGEARWIPNERGALLLNGFYIQDQVAKRDRYRAFYKQEQQFRNGFRMVADLDWVSDFNYYSDYERDINLISSPTILARLEFSRNGAWTSLNVRELRREQLLFGGSSLIQQTLPEIEWRGRSRQLGRTPFYLSFESSAAAIRQKGEQFSRQIDADYQRFDLFPTVTLPWSPLPWLDITPGINYRWTYYTQHFENVETPGGGLNRTEVDDDLVRALGAATLDIIGPKIYRVFESPESRFSSRYKHVIEPRVGFSYSERFERADEIIVFDEVDRFVGGGNTMIYRLIQRLFAKRPQVEGAPPPRMAETIVNPDGSAVQAPPEPAGQEIEAAQAQPLEIATLELAQVRSFENDLSFADLDRDGVNETTSSVSDVQIVGRYNPNPLTSLDLRSNYHILYNKIRDVTLAGGIRQRLATLRFSVVYRNGLGVVPVTTTDDQGNLVQMFEDARDDTQLRLTGGFHFLQGRLRFDVDGSLIVDPPQGQKQIPEYRWRAQYQTQCCVFMLEQLTRNFSFGSDRDDFYFRVDLTGVGKLLDVSY